MDKKIVHAEPQGWENIAREGYREGAAGVVRHTLIGQRKMSAGDPGPTIELRYFEVAPGAATRLEKHEHEHTVIVGAGSGYAIVGTELHEVGPRDIVYVGAMVPHQFVCRGDAPFGFYCAVTTLRDFSQELSPRELAALRASAAGSVMAPEGPARSVRLRPVEHPSRAE